MHQQLNFFLQVESILALEFICFPSTTRASLKNGQIQLMSELQLGDQVLAGLIYTSILSFFFRKLIIFILNSNYFVIKAIKKLSKA